MRQGQIFYYIYHTSPLYVIHLFKKYKKTMPEIFKIVSNLVVKFGEIPVMIYKLFR